jgi:ribosomal protein S12 methylthiotransferase accessory factor YcaO
VVHNDTAEEDLAWVEQQLTSCGMNRRFVVNLIREDIGLQVVKVLVPNLEAPPELCCAPGPRASRLNET